MKRQNRGPGYLRTVKEALDDIYESSTMSSMISKERNKETRFGMLRFEKILHTLAASAKKIIEEKEQLMKLKKGEDLQSEQNVGESPQKH